MKALGTEDGLRCVCGCDSGQGKRTCELLFLSSCMYLLIYVRMTCTFAGISCLVEGSLDSEVQPQWVVDMEAGNLLSASQELSVNLG